MLGFPHGMFRKGLTPTILGFSSEGKEGAIVLEVGLSPTVMAHDLVSSTMTHEGWRKGYAW